MGTISDQQTDAGHRVARKTAGCCCLILLVVLLAGCSQFSLHRAFQAGEQSLSPSSATLSAGESVDFTVTGGLPPYEFTVDDNTGNTFERVSEETARFTVEDKQSWDVRAYTWNVTVTDARGQSSSATVETAVE